MQEGLLIGALLPAALTLAAWTQPPVPAGVHVYQAVPASIEPPQGGVDGPVDVSWVTLDSGIVMLGAGRLEVGMTLGQPDAGVLTGPGGIEVFGGFWPLPELPTLCYANCDFSTAPPILNVNDFQCFINLFAAEDPRANCDDSTAPPILNVNDFQCFLNRFAAGCT